MCRITHSIQRAAERYGVTLNPWDIHEMDRLLEERNSTTRHLHEWSRNPDGGTSDVYRIHYMGTRFYALVVSNRVRTFIPGDRTEWQNYQRETHARADEIKRRWDKPKLRRHKAKLWFGIHA